MGNAGEAVVGVVAAGDGVAVGAAANAGDVFSGDGAVGVVAVGDLVAVALAVGSDQAAGFVVGEGDGVGGGAVGAVAGELIAGEAEFRNGARPLRFPIFAFLAPDLLEFQRLSHWLRVCQPFFTIKNKIFQTNADRYCV